jgi:hypothetical protein
MWSCPLWCQIFYAIIRVFNSFPTYFLARSFLQYWSASQISAIILFQLVIIYFRALIFQLVITLYNYTFNNYYGVLYTSEP